MGALKSVESEVSHPGFRGDFAVGLDAAELTEGSIDFLRIYKLVEGPWSRLEAAHFTAAQLHRSRQPMSVRLRSGKQAVRSTSLHARTHALADNRC